MGYFSIGMKLIVVQSVVFLGALGLICPAGGADISPREQTYLLSPQKTFEYYCSPCHGFKGKGDGTFFTIDLKPKPRNFTDADYMKKRTDDQLAKSITDGSKSVEKSNLCPPWGKTLSEKRIKELVSCIRGFSTHADEKPIVAAKEKVSAEKKSDTFKSSLRWLFLAVITLALAGGAISELKKLKSESSQR